MSKYIWSFALGVLVGMLLWIFFKAIAVVALVVLAVVGAYTLYNTANKEDSSEESSGS